MQINQFKKRIYGILTVAVMLIIFLFSDQPGHESSALSGTIANLLKNAGLILNVRKCAHIFLYFCLGMSSSLYCAECLERRPYMVAAMFCFLYSCSDEWHQTFIVGRTGSFGDVGIDAIGFALGILGCWYYKKLFRGFIFRH